MENGQQNQQSSFDSQQWTENDNSSDNLRTNYENITREIFQYCLKSEPITPEESKAKDVRMNTEEITNRFHEKNNIGNFDHKEVETRLPLKKRKLSVASSTEEIDDDFFGSNLVEEIIRRAGAKQSDRKDISYPAKPMISIAEVQETFSEPQPRLFKTPAEKKEMPRPPPPHQESAEIMEQYNNHTYNNPTMNYHVDNFPYPSSPYFPSILLPTTFGLNSRQQQKHQMTQNYVKHSEKSNEDKIRR